jgi:hypothetical protein
MEEKNPDNHAPDAIGDTRGPEVEKRKRDYDQVAKEEVAPTREYSFSNI